MNAEKYTHVHAPIKERGARISAIVSGASLDVTICSRCLSKRPEARYPSVRALAVA